MCKRFDQLSCDKKISGPIRRDKREPMGGRGSVWQWRWVLVSGVNLLGSFARQQRSVTLTQESRAEASSSTVFSYIRGTGS